MTEQINYPAIAENFMPHSKPMALIDSVLECYPDRVITRVDISDASLFSRDGMIPAWVGIEYMAQSCAAWSGIISKQNSQLKQKPPIGYLLGTRQYSALCSGFYVGDALFIYAECLLQSEDGLGSFDCRIERNSEVVATARLSVYQPK